MSRPDSESTRLILDKLFQVERFHDFEARWSTYCDHEPTSDGERDSSESPAWRARLMGDLPKAHSRLEEDRNREQKSAMTLTRLHDPDTSHRLRRFLEHTGQATFEQFASAACEVADLWSEASAARVALSNSMARVSATKAGLPIPLRELQTRSACYLQSFGRARSRIRQAERELTGPIRALHKAQYEHVTREVEELMACLEQRAALEAGMRVGATLASVVALRDISRRVVCKMIARGLDALSYTP